MKTVNDLVTERDRLKALNADLVLHMQALLNAMGSDAERFYPRVSAGCLAVIAKAKRAEGKS